MIFLFIAFLTACLYNSNKLIAQVPEEDLRTAVVASTDGCMLPPPHSCPAACTSRKINFFTSLFSQMGVPIEIAVKYDFFTEYIISNESYEKLKCVFIL